MNTKLLGLLAAATLATAACTQEKKTEETTVTTTPDATTTTTTTTTVDTAAYRNEADALAARVAEDLKLQDTTVVRRIRTVYYTRGRKLNSYTTDTTGRYAAIRAANDEANQEIKTILTNPSEYNTYSSNLGTYYAGQPYTVVVVEQPKRTGSAGVGQGSAVKKMEREDDGDKKTKYENGAKIKREDDGSVKIKRADGTKVKIDEEGNRTVKKGLFK
ncbi:hypothetical protein [Hymenobacter negativus]|uniref:Lipoprotein n=1 Tax=Hymenobacter negativus TaxID=2795026 RepID=A0ABS3QFQ8_9BACT|nr:hypothetical protein [Hymenobacter negativus]MBO2009936.1 hypothetical protein [Hymenobacter negativus]